MFSGTVYARDGKFSGDIYSENAYIRGEIHGTSGSFVGQITSNANGDTIAINPDSRSITFTNSLSQEVIRQDFFVNDRYSGGKIRINLVDQETGEDHCYCEINGGKIAVYTKDRYSFFNADAYQKKIWIDADLLPQGRDNAYPKEVYMDGETMKIHRGG